MLLLPILMAGGNSGTVTLTADSIADAVIGGCFAAFHFNTDGTIDEDSTTGGAVQINSGTDWIIPNSASSLVYYIRFERTVGASTGYSGPAMSSWHSLDTLRTIQHTVGAEDSNGATYTAEIASDSGGSNILAGPVNFVISAIGL